MPVCCGGRLMYRVLVHSTLVVSCLKCSSGEDGGCWSPLFCSGCSREFLRAWGEGIYIYGKENYTLRKKVEVVEGGVNVTRGVRVPLVCVCGTASLCCIGFDRGWCLEAFRTVLPRAPCIFTVLYHFMHGA